MSSALASHANASTPGSEADSQKSAGSVRSLGFLLTALRDAQATCIAQPANTEASALFGDLRRQVARSVLQLSKRQTDSAEVTDVRLAIQQIAASGLNDTPATGEDLALAQQALSQAWPGLLAAMLLVASWQLPQAPALDAVPDWLWDDFSSWLFTAPQGFCGVGQAEAYAAHTLRRLKELNTWVERNAGSGAVRAAFKAYLDTGSAIPLYFSQDSLKEHAIVRGKLLARAFNAHRDTYDPLTLPREGRRLKIGFINRHFGSQTETYTTLPTFEALDPERFEVVLFSCRATDSALETYCRAHAQELQVLPTELSAQLEVLRAANLDVAVFGTNVTALCNEITRIALHRVAPLQVANNSSCITTGLPNIDLYVSGSLTEAPSAPEHFTERLGLLPGPAHAFNYRADRQAATTAWKRADIGIPEDAVVFVTAANYFKIIPEMQRAWAKLLAQVPNSFLLVHPFNPNWSPKYPSDRFSAEMDRALVAAGVSPNRLIVSTLKFQSREDVKELLRVGDIYLDTYPFGGVNSLIDPLELGMPVVVWEGETFRSRMGAAIMRSLGLNELIATDADSYQRIVLDLSTSADARRTLGARIVESMEREPVFLDTLAASDAFGELINLAFDELVTVGRDAFRTEKKPLQAEVVDTETLVSTGTYLLDLGMADEASRQVQRALAAQPNAIGTRQFMAKILNGRGQHARAAEYLLAAVRSGQAPALVWRELAATLRKIGRGADAISAIETAIRLDQNDVESWFLLGEIAHQCGHQGILADVANIVSKLAPDDSRTAIIQGVVQQQKAS
jgi:predicted O-linked N-acetylglucosamine transferase (SPINDLY family)